MFTESTVEMMEALAGADRAWDNGRPGWKPNSKVKKALRLDLIARQGGLCPVCGNGLRFAQFNHVVSRGPNVKGFLPLNIFAGCALCNLDCALTFGTVSEDGSVIDGGVIPYAHFARPDLIPTEWTPFTILKEWDV